MIPPPKENMEWDWSEIKFVVKVFNYLSDVRPGLQIPILYTLCARISAPIVGGRCVVLVGRKGCGKGDTIKATMGCVPRLKIMYTDELTSDGVISWLRDFDFMGADIECSMDDLSMSADRYDHLSRTLNVASKLCSDKQIGLTNRDAARLHISKSDKNKWVARVGSFSCVVGATNSILSRVKGFEAFRSMWSDRFTRFFPIMTTEQFTDKIQRYANRTKGYKKVSTEDVNEEIKRMMPKRFHIPKEPFDMKVDEDVFVYLRENLYEKQHTEVRGADFLRGELTALALLNGRPYITESDIAIYMLFVPNLFLSGCRPLVRDLAQTAPSYYGDIDRLSYKLMERQRRIKDAIETCNYEQGWVNNPVRLIGHKVLLNQDLKNILNSQEDLISGCKER